jgi:hypothetical protein
MKKYLLVFLATMTSLVIISCQKELSNENGIGITPPPLTVTDSNYIDTVYEFETRTGITDTTAYYSYKYDAQKRVVSINWQWADFALPYQDSGSIRYFYSGTDSLPARSLLTATYNGMLVFDTTVNFYTYDIGARLTKDSTVAAERDVSFPYYRLRHYTDVYNYPAGKIVRQSSDLPVIEPDPAAYPPTFTMDTVITGANQNPVSSVSYVAYNTPAAFSKDYTTAITYDNNPNPYYKLNIFKTFSPIPVVEGPGFFSDFIGKNNFTIYNTIYTGSSSTIPYTNSFLVNGYIKTSSYPALFNPLFTDGYLYVYKAL